MELQYTIVIPAFNEEQYLKATLDAMKEAMTACQSREASASSGDETTSASQYNGEIIVVDNNSTDNTAKIAEENGAKVVFEGVNQISRARNAGGRAAKSKWLIFVDADTLINGDLLRRTLDNLAAGDCCGGGALVLFDEELHWPAYYFVDLWNYLALRLGLAAGSYVYCLREGFEAVGGFSEKVYASEEVWYSRALKQWGLEKGLSFKVITEARALTSNRKLHWYSTIHVLLQFVLFFLFPFALYSKRLCNLWYARPSSEYAPPTKECAQPSQGFAQPPKESEPSD